MSLTIFSNFVIKYAAGLLTSKMFSFRGQDDYIAGNIVEIELHNFMTFDHLICKPGSRLNLVIGPNGSGKSSLVCAIALALGGEPQVSLCLSLCLIIIMCVFLSYINSGLPVAAWQGHKYWGICEER